jgi:hypothetical protein
MSPCVGPGGIGWSDVRPSPQPDVSITRRSSFPAGSLARIVSNHPTKNSSQRKIGQERMGQRATTLRMQRRGPPADPEQSRSAPRILLADGHLRSRPPLFHTRSRAALTWCEPSLVENRSLARVSPRCATVSVVVSRCGPRFLLLFRRPSLGNCVGSLKRGAVELLLKDGPQGINAEPRHAVVEGME